MCARGHGLIVRLRRQEIWVAQTNCMSWQCPECRWLLRRQLAQKIAAGTPNKFLTITFRRRNTGSKDDHARELLAAWQPLLKRIKRFIHAKHIPYCRVVEAQDNGEPHIHAAMRCVYIPQPVISRWCGELLNSPIVDIRAVYNVGDVAAYLTEYLSAAPADFRGIRRWGCSQDWIIKRQTEPHDETSQDYRIVQNEKLAVARAILIELGWRLVSEHRGRIHATHVGAPVVPVLWLPAHADTERTRRALPPHVAADAAIGWSRAVPT